MVSLKIAKIGVNTIICFACLKLSVQLNSHILLWHTHGRKICLGLLFTTVSCRQQTQLATVHQSRLAGRCPNGGRSCSHQQ